MAGIWAGTATIVASYDTISSSAVQVTVTSDASASLASIAVAPSAPSTALGLTQQFAATGTFSDGSTRDITTNVTWSVTNGTGSASIGSSTGLLASLGGATGTVTVTAALGTVSGTASQTITAPVVSSIVVTPASATVSLGHTQQYTATATYSDLTTADVTSSATWSESNGTGSAAINSSSGLATTVGGAQGSTTITAVYSGKTDSTTLTVGAASAASGLYIADVGNNRIRKVNSSDVITTILGDGTNALSGNGGAAASAQSVPAYTVIDSTGDIFFVDPGHPMIRVIAGANGTIFGQAVTAGNVYAITGDGSTSSAATNGGLASTNTVQGPTALVLDSNGNLYFSDSSRIWVIAAQTGTIFGVSVTANHVYTVAGTGVSGYSGNGGGALAAEMWNATGIAFDSSGNLYISSALEDTLRVVANITGNIFSTAVTPNNIYTLLGTYTTASTTGDGGLATSATANMPSGVYVDSAGNVYFSEFNGHVVRVIAASTGTLFGVATTANFVHKIAGTTGIANYSGDSGLAISATLHAPKSLRMDAAGNLYISDNLNYCVRVIAGVTGTIFGISVTANDIYTVAGIGTSTGLSGDGAAATSAQIGNDSRWTIEVIP